MIPKSESKAENGLPGVTKALYRAAQRARVVAANTGTPLVFSAHGHIEKRWISHDSIHASREEFEHYLKAVPDAVPPETDQIK
ncbi:MAG TPA: hypothetical protein VMS31_04125 [Pyrinomonadaceae bacterium]|nr:hypothetical protein [Pyrinomonadaceae bacterium]